MSTISAKTVACGVNATQRPRLTILATLRGLRNTATRVWVGIREWCGDNAYDRYVQAQRKMADGAVLLTPTEFYVEQLNRRYSRPNRCC